MAIALIHYTGAIIRRVVTFSNSTSATVTVKDGSTAITSGSKIKKGTVLTITATAKTGYNTPKAFVNGTQLSGTSYTVGDVDAVITVSASPIQYTWSATTTNSTVAVNRTSSPIGGGKTGNLTTSDKLYYNDVVKVSGTPNSGYGTPSFTVTHNGSTSKANPTSISAVRSNITATCSVYKLSISATKTTVKVERTASPNNPNSSWTADTLTNGAAIYAGDKLKITFTANTYYSNGTHTVNGSTFTSGSTHNVAGNVSIVGTSTVIARTLTISPTHTTITVNRTSSPNNPNSSGTTGNLSNGATIYGGDVLKITYTAATYYTLATHTAGGTTVASGGTYTVTGDTTVVGKSNPTQYKLTISSTNTSVTVNRTSSPIGGGATGNLSNNAIIYGNDVLKVTFTANTYYTLATHTVAGSAFTSGGSYTVKGNTAVVGSSNLTAYTLSITATNTTVTVNRTASSKANAGTGNITSGTKVYYGDTLKITFAAKNAAYSNSTHTVNGSAFTSGNSHSVVGNVTVVGTSTLIEKTLTITSTNTSITVNRTSSPNAGKATGNLASGAKVSPGDVLKISFAGKNAAYSVATHTVNGSTFTSGNNFTVANADIAVVGTSTLVKYKLTITNSNTTITANRTSSPNGGLSTGNLANNADICNGDVIKFTVSPVTNYTSATMTVAGSAFTSGNSYTVKSANLTAAGTAIALFAPSNMTTVRTGRGSYGNDWTYKSTNGAVHTESAGTYAQISGNKMSVFSFKSEAPDSASYAYTYHEGVAAKMTPSKINFTGKTTITIKYSVSGNTYGRPQMYVAYMENLPTSTNIAPLSGVKSFANADTSVYPYTNYFGHMNLVTSGSGTITMHIKPVSGSYYFGIEVQGDVPTSESVRDSLQKVGDITLTEVTIT